MTTAASSSPNRRPHPRPEAEGLGTRGRTPVRLTRRGRIVLAGLVLAAGLGAGSVVVPALTGDDPGESLTLAGQSRVVVQSGDTLWSIAVELAPDADPRVLVDALQEANHLADAALVPGQVLVVP